MVHSSVASFKMKFCVSCFFHIALLQCVISRHIWHSNYLYLPEKNENGFSLKNVSLAQDFSLNFTVKFWRTLNTKDISCAVGFTENQIIILKGKIGKTPDQAKKFNVISKSHEIDINYVDAALVKISNPRNIWEGVFLVAVSNDGILDWYTTDDVILYWRINLQCQARFVKIEYNNNLQRHQLLIISESNLIIYNFGIEAKEIWLTQTIHLPEYIGSLDTASYRDDFFIFLPQTTTGQLNIFKCSDGHFQSYKNISSVGIHQVVAFHENFKTFFAVAGLRAAIYRFDRRGAIIKERIANSHLDGIKYWLPVNVKNLKENLILFAQRTLEHSSHQSFVVETFTYNNKHFEEHEDIPCYIFGEKFNTLQCLAYDVNSVGIEGASYVTMGDNLRILLAKVKPQNMFVVNFQRNVPEDPVWKEIKKLNETRNKLQELMDKRLLHHGIDSTAPDMEKVTTSKPVPFSFNKTKASYREQNITSDNLREEPIVGAPKNLGLLQKLDDILEKVQALQVKMDKVEQMRKFARFKTLIVNGSAQINNGKVDKVSSSTINDDDADSVLKDIVRKNQLNTVDGIKTFSDVNVNHLFFEFVNDIKGSDIIFSNAQELTINGDITFEKNVAVLANIKTDWINDIPSSDIVDMKKQIDGSLSFETIHVNELQTGELNKIPISETWFHSINTEESSKLNSVFFPYNLTVKRINGDDFESFLRELCLINIPTYLPGRFIVNGDVIVEEPAKIKYLNTIKFPENYFFSDGTTGFSISGQKNFKNILQADEVRTNNNYINGIRPDEYFTLSTPQDITGKTTFANLTITRKFELNGHTIGGQVQEFLPNPTLTDTKIVKSNIIFENLEVTGDIIIENDLNQMDFRNMIRDIVYKDEENTSINSIKEFPEGLTVRKDLLITSNSINLIPIDQIVTKDTRQILHIPQLNGNVSIEIMKINQLLNDINVTKLDQETVKTCGEQFISSILIFKQDFEAAHLEIEEEFDAIPVQNYLTTTGNRVIVHDTVFDSLQAGDVRIGHDFEGTINEINLREFFQSRMSYSVPQNITQYFSIENSTIMNLECGNIEKSECKDIFNRDNVKNMVLAAIESNRMKVKDLIVYEALEVKKLDGISLSKNELLQEKSLIFHGDVHFSNLNITKLSEVSLRRFLENIFFKNDSSLQVSGIKNFKNGFTVEKLVETDMINNVPIKNLLTKEGTQNIIAPIEILGNVTFKTNIEIVETMNEVPLHGVEKYFELNDTLFIIRDNIVFERLPHIDTLEVFGHINGRDVDQFLQNIAYRNNHLIFAEEMEFNTEVIVEGDIAITENLNDINLSDINEIIIYKNKNESNRVHSVVTFTDRNTFAAIIYVETNLETKWMYGINLEHWKQNGVFMYKGLLPGRYQFENITVHDKLVTETINKICMNKTFPLNSNQIIDHLSFKIVGFLNNVTVGRGVNGFTLQHEYDNTVLSNKEQQIMSSLHFHNNTLIRNNIEVAGLLNGYPLNKLATTDTNQNLTALYSFPSKVILESNLNVNGTVNKINMSIWEHGAVRVVSEGAQDIDAPWIIRGNLTFEEPLQGENIIYNFNIDGYKHLLQEQRRLNHYIKERYQVDQQNICRDLRYLSKESRKLTYSFESFEELQTINYPLVIGKAHFFMDDKPILLINGVKSCESDLFVFENDQFVNKSRIQLGEIDQIISVLDPEHRYFVVKVTNNSRCDIEGTNVWKYKNFSVQKLQNIENQQQLQESLVPQTFYGLNKRGVTEFNIDMRKIINVFPYRRWKVFEDNMAFVPRGLGTGLALRTDRKLIKLIKKDPLEDNEVDSEEIILRGEMNVTENFVFPGKNNSNIEVIKVGPKNLRKTFLAVVFHEDTLIQTHVDVIKIYEYHSNDRVFRFQLVPTFNPTAMLSIELDSGETFLLVLENEKKLQILQYRGIEGFVQRLSADTSGSYMFKIRLPLGPNGKMRDSICVIDREKIRLINPVIQGETISENFDTMCST